MTATGYRVMANEVRDLVPLLIHPQAAADLRLLADWYERLAHCLEVAHGTPPDMPLEFRRRQAN
jgi:hypothetical protein